MPEFCYGFQRGKVDGGTGAQKRRISRGPTTHPGASAVSLATARSGELLDWSSMDKVALIVFSGSPALVVALFRVYRLLEHPELEPYIDRYWLAWVAHTVEVSLVVLAAFVPIWLAVRKKYPEHRGLIGGVLSLFLVLLGIGSYLLGHVSTPMYGGLIAVICALLLFFEIRLAVRLSVFALLTFFVPLVLIALRVLPYGPVFSEAPFVGRNASPEWVASTSLFAFVIALIPTFALAKVVQHWRSRDAVLFELARLDMLTRVANRGYFFDRLVVELERARRHRGRIALLLLDLDHFKRVNDAYGHLVGDAALVHVTRVVGQQVLRRTDLMGRYGGEEFIVLLPETDLEGALIVAERCRAAVASEPLLLDDESKVRLTVSVGVATPSSAFDADELLHRVDVALYRAKELGRNRVEHEPPPPGQEFSTESMEVVSVEAAGVAEPRPVSSPSA